MSGSTTVDNYFRLYQPQDPFASPSRTSFLTLGAYRSEPSDVQPQSGLVTHLSTIISGTSTNRGLQLFTDRDIQKNVLGFKRSRYGAGHKVEIAAGDYNLTVSKGGVSISAAQDIALSSGDQNRADVSINATNQLYQYSSGDLSKKTYGTKSSITHGLTAKVFSAAKNSLHLGFHINVSAGASIVSLVGLDLQISAGPRMEVYLAGRYLKKNGYQKEYFVGNHVMTHIGDMSIKSLLKTEETIGLDYEELVVGQAERISRGTSTHIANRIRKTNEFELKQTAASIFESASLNYTMIVNLGLYDLKSIDSAEDFTNVTATYQSFKQLTTGCYHCDDNKFTQENGLNSVVANRIITIR